MSNSVIGLSIDCADAAKLARFCAEVLGRPVSPEPTAEFAAIAAGEATQGPPLSFHQVPEAKTVKNRLHLDLISSDAATGKIRKTPVMRIERDGTYVAVASAAGAPKHPAWYHNLIANPDLRLQDGAQVHRLRAREVFGEGGGLGTGRIAMAHFPEDRAKAWREIPILLLEPDTPGEQ